MDDKLLQLYFEGNTTDEQSHLITAWIDESDAHLLYYQQLCRLYEISLWHESSDVAHCSEPSFSWKKIVSGTLKIAAIFAFGFFLSYWTHLPQEETRPLMQTVYAPSGQNARLTLCDGSKVWLNAGSTLSFPTQFTDNKRTVILEGEAFFEVQSNKEKPFIVSTAGYTIKALGTSFNVNAYKQSCEFETALLTGQVEVSNLAKTQTIMLTPNNRVVLIDNKLKTFPIQDSSYFLWREGIVCFNESLADVLDKLELYFNVEIQIKNKRILQSKEHCTGKFRTRDGLDHILNVLQLTSHFSYTKDEDKNLIIIN